MQGSCEHGVQLSESQRQPDQRFYQHFDQGLHHQLSGFAGYRYDRQIGTSNIDCTLFDCPWKACCQQLGSVGEISISGTLIKADELANSLQVCLDSGAKKVLIPSTSFVDFASVPADLMSAFQLIPYQSAEDAVFKALGVE